MAGITTHVLDTGSGKPIPGVKIDLAIRDGDAWRALKSTVSNADGRTDKPLLPPDEAKVGQYQLSFDVADYLAQRDSAAFIDNPVVRFALYDVKAPYHIPMLCTPGSFTTYRGS